MEGQVRSIPAVLAACFAAVWSAGAAAQGAGCVPDAEIASALDNFQLAWSVAKGRVGTEASPERHGSPGSFWKRVTDETHDRVDGLRSGSVGDNEHAYLSTRVVGPATLRFWWKVDSEELGDYLTFAAVVENESSIADGLPGRTIFERSISGDQGWAEVVVALPEETSYLARWSYVKDGSGRSDADAGWIDEVRVEGAGYGDIALNEPEEFGTDAIKLSWETIPCRHYQVFWRPKDTDGQWRSRISKVEPATGVVGSVLERSELFEKREYRVRLLAPPSFTRSPRSREFALTEGDPFSLVYEAEGSVPFRYRWYFRAAGANSPPRALAAGDGIAIDSGVGGSELKIAELRERDEGEYFLVAENAAGRETAPGVSVEVFQPPGLSSFQVKAGEDEPHRVEVGATEDGLAAVRVNEGEGLVLNAEVTGSGPISSIWERRADATAPWRRVSGEDASTLSIESATSDDAGQYRLTLESRWGGPTFGPKVEVAVNLPPQARLVVEGERDEVRMDEALALTVEVMAGTPPLFFQWYRDGHAVPAEDGGESATVAVATNRAGLYMYEAQVSNAAGLDQTLKHEITVLSSNGTVFRDGEECPKMTGIGAGSEVDYALSIVVHKGVGLDRAKVCIQKDEMVEFTLAGYFCNNGMTFTPVVVRTKREAQEAYLSGVCDAYAFDSAILSEVRSRFSGPHNVFLTGIGAGSEVDHALSIVVHKGVGLDRAKVCIQKGEVVELTLAAYFRNNGMTFTPVVVRTKEEAQEAYLHGVCDAYAFDSAILSEVRSRFSGPHNVFLTGIGAGSEVDHALSIVVHKGMGLDRAKVCIQKGEAVELTLAAYFRNNGMTFTPVVVRTKEEAQEAYLHGVCDAYAFDSAILSEVRSRFSGPHNVFLTGIGAGSEVDHALSIVVHKGVGLDRAKVCIQKGEVVELTLAAYFRNNGMTFTPVVVRTKEEAQEAYLHGVCDAYAFDSAILSEVRSRFSGPNNVFLERLFSR